jgi:hypothetical protein
MESSDIHAAFRQLLRVLLLYARQKDLTWLKASSISFAAHLIVMPLLFLLVMPPKKPPGRQPVFMLAGGLRITEVESEEGGSAKEDLSLLDEEAEEEEYDETEIDKRVLEKLAQERKEIFSLPVQHSPIITYTDIDEEEEEEDEEEAATTATAEDEERTILDEAAGEEEGENKTAGLEKAKGKVREPGEGQGETKPALRWEDIFAKNRPVEKLPPAKTEADGKIESLMAANPYDDGAAARLPPGTMLTGSFFGEGEGQLPDLLVWLPPDIRLAGLISLSIIRSRPDREVFEKTFKKLPYFDSVAAGSDLDFFQQLDAVLIATNNPFDVKETFLVLRHNQDEKMIRKAVSKHFASMGVKENWYRISGKDVVQPSKKSFDKIPWIYFFPAEKVVGVVHISRRGSIKTLMDAQSADAGGASHLVGPLERLMRFGTGMPEGAKSEDGQAMPAGVVVGSVHFDEIMAGLDKSKKFPLPAETMVIGRFSGNLVSVEGTALFPDGEGPKKFLAQWQNTLKPLRQNKILKFFGIEKILDFPVWKEGSGGNLTLQALVPPERVEPLLALIRLITGGENKTLEDKFPPPKKP